MPARPGMLPLMRCHGRRAWLFAALTLSVAGCRSRSDESVVSALTETGSKPLVAGAPTIVILGSSTAAGTGPREPKNAWPRRYAAYLAQQFPHYQLVNLAVGGQTTYHVQASGFVPPAGRPTPVEGKNITAALRLHPRGLIVNLPSNDSAERIAPQEQLANLERIAQLAERSGVRVWVTTTQPRNFSDPQCRAQLAVRDGINTRFAPRILDFWQPFASATQRVKPEYDAGDGVHLNDAAHAILAQTVIAARLPQTLDAP